MNEEIFLLVEAYVLGRMSPEERNAFEQRLASDAELRGHVDTMRRLQKGIAAAGREKLRKEIFPPRQNSFVIPLQVKRVLAIAATVTLAIVAYLFLVPDQGEKLYQAYYAPADTVYLRRPRGEDEDYVIKVQALEDYKASHYRTALDSLKKIEKPDEESSLLSGLASMELHDWTEADKHLRLAMGGTSQNSVTASWFLAMVYVHQKNFTAAQQLLKTLSDKPNPYHDGAVRLLHELPI